MSRTALEAEPDSRPPPEDDHAFFGRPKGLLTLSGLEVWERFSFLGMQAILVLHFADSVAHGGMGMSSGTAASVSAAYGTLVYLVPVAGGRLADRILGSFRAVLWGGIRRRLQARPLRRQRRDRGGRGPRGDGRRALAAPHDAPGPLKSTEPSEPTEPTEPLGSRHEPAHP